jgi:hypothetical protein
MFDILSDVLMIVTRIYWNAVYLIAVLSWSSFIVFLAFMVPCLAFMCDALASVILQS